MWHVQMETPRPVRSPHRHRGASVSNLTAKGGPTAELTRKASPKIEFGGPLWLKMDSRGAASVTKIQLCVFYRAAG